MYEYQGERPLREDDPYGLHAGYENYAASKIGAEYLMRHISEDYGLPVTFIRIFTFYGPRGGAISQRIDQVAKGLPVSVYPGVRNVYTPLFEDVRASVEAEWRRDATRRQAEAAYAGLKARYRIDLTRLGLSE